MMAEKPAKRTKRRVKDPDNFRERASKSLASNGKFKKSKRVIKDQSKSASKSVPKLVQKPANILGKILLPTYFRNSWRELKQVAWPSWRESRRLTFAVIVFAIIFGLSIAGVDYVIDKIFRQLLLK